MKVTILGCGSSGGVPLVGCECTTCRSDNPKNKRLRTSVLVEADGTRLLIDTSPDLRQQALTAQFSTVDAILYTHNHADHTHGIDDIRAFNFHRNGRIPAFGTAEMLERLQQQFPYVFADAPSTRWLRPALAWQVIEEYDTFSVEALEVRSFLQFHGNGKTLGYRIGKFAYSTDVNNLPNESLQVLDSLDVWVVDCLRYDPAPTHAHLAQTLDWIAAVKPKRAVLIHMGHELEYELLHSELPAHVEPAYDGMVIEL